MDSDDRLSHPTFFLNTPKIKITDEKFYNFFMKPEIHRLLYERYIYNILPTLSLEKQEELKLQLGHEALFAIHTTCFPEFLRYVRKQVRKTKWFQTQITELGFLIAIDLLYGEKATIRKTKEVPKEDYRNSTLIYERVTNRTRQRLFQQYPELLSKPLRETMIELEDEREQPFRTIYSEPSIGDMNPEYLSSVPIPLDEYDIKFIILQQVMMPLHSMYRMVEPYDTEELIHFHKYIKASITVLIQQFGEPDDENQWIRNHLFNGTNLTEHLYHTILLAVIRRWFRKKKPSARLKLLRERHPLRYTRKDAHLAVKYTKEWVQNSWGVFDTISRGVKGLNEMRKFKPGLWLYNECLDQLELIPEDKGLCFHNLAIQYRHLQTPRKYKIYLQKAMKIWNEIDSKYDIAVTWGFLSHAYYLLSETKKQIHAKEMAITLLDKLVDTDFRLSWGYIHMADNAYLSGDIRWEMEALSKGLDHAAQVQDESFFNYINERLIALHQGKNSYILERMGLIRRPSLMPWMKIGSSYQSILPSKKTPTA